jgi:hypothetical protein
MNPKKISPLMEMEHAKKIIPTQTHTRVDENEKKRNFN